MRAAKIALVVTACLLLAIGLMMRHSASFDAAEASEEFCRGVSASDIDGMLHRSVISAGVASWLWNLPRFRATIGTCKVESAGADLAGLGWRGIVKITPGGPIGPYEMTIGGQGKRVTRISKPFNLHGVDNPVGQN